MALWNYLNPGLGSLPSGHCTLEFPWTQGHICITLNTAPANYSLLKARWGRSVFHWYDHVAASFVPSLRLEDVITDIEALTKFTQQALNDSQQDINLLNSEVSFIGMAILQNWMILDITIASQGSTCAIIQTECCVLYQINHLMSPT